MTALAKTWAELFPEGRELYYEGDLPETFATLMVKLYGFDPRIILHVDGRKLPNHSWATCGYFICPAHALDEVHSGAWRVGS